MTVRKIVTTDVSEPNEEGKHILRVKCAKIVDFGPDLTCLISDLKDTLRSDDLSVGLAAPQIGVDAAVAIVNLNKHEDKDLVLINPRIISTSGQWDEKYESCMSHPHKRGKVKRKKKVHLEYQNLQGEWCEYKASSFEARVILHEIDHLNGTLYFDHMEEHSELEETDLFKKHGIN